MLTSFTHQRYFQLRSQHKSVTLASIISVWDGKIKKQEALLGRMIKPYFSCGLSLALLALTLIKQVDAFVAVPSSQAVSGSQALFALPKIVKKGEKVVTEPDIGGAVQALVSIYLGKLAKMKEENYFPRGYE